MKGGRKMENQKEEEKQGTVEDTDEGDKHTSTPVIDAANKAAERLEKANEEQKEILKKQEMLMAKNALGGKSEAGDTPQKKKELTPEEYSDAVLRGEVNPLKDDGFIN